MPYGWYFSDPVEKPVKKVGHPKRDRSKNKAARKARRRH